MTEKPRRFEAAPPSRLLMTFDPHRDWGWVVRDKEHGAVVASRLSQAKAEALAARWNDDQTQAVPPGICVYCRQPRRNGKHHYVGSNRAVICQIYNASSYVLWRPEIDPDQFWGDLFDEEEEFEDGPAHGPFPVGVTHAGSPEDAEDGDTILRIVKPADRSEPRESWADIAGFTVQEWDDYCVLRREYRARRTRCPWCRGTGQFESSSDEQYRCTACETSGSVDLWTALHAPHKSEDYESEDEPWFYSTPSDVPLRYSAYSDVPVRSSSSFERPAQPSALRDRLDTLVVLCPDCDGTGRVGHNYACRTCDWAGTLSAYRVATHVTIACPRCEGVGIGGGPGTGWGCSYCSMTGRIDIDRLEPLSRLSVGNNWGFWLNIEQLASEGAAESYDMWSAEFNPRQEAMPGVYWAGVDLSGEDLSGLDLSEADLSGCQLGDVAGTRLIGANLSGASIFGDTDGTDFTNANLSQAIMYANLTGSTIHLAADVTGLDLSEARGLTEEQLRELVAKGAQLRNDQADRSPPVVTVEHASPWEQLGLAETDE